MLEGTPHGLTEWNRVGMKLRTSSYGQTSQVRGSTPSAVASPGCLLWPCRSLLLSLQGSPALMDAKPFLRPAIATRVPSSAVLGSTASSQIFFWEVLFVVTARPAAETSAKMAPTTTMAAGNAQEVHGQGRRLQA